MSLTLGRDPEGLTVRLVPGVEWWTTLHRRDGVDWPDGSAIELRFADGTVWPATIDGPDALFSRTLSQVAELIPSGRQQVDLRYSDGTHDLLWARGRVSLHD